ncbi:MAG: hypothetical protein D6752_02805 [Candidatus Nitrosothermus koennekii]|nr:MAG: hypothetical protein D6752_02805 [Candidatus Nitrosothermus koennekii]
MQQYIEYSVDTNGLRYSVLIFRFANGYFIAITEGDEHKLGYLGIATPNSVITPLKSDLYAKMISQRIASISNKLCIVSINAKEINPINMKKIMNSIMERIG